MSTKNPKVQIISISGLDGSGKTTQTNMIKNYLETQGNKVFYFHAIQFSIANKINNLFKRKKKKANLEKVVESNQDTGESVSQAGWFLIQIRKIFLIIDIFRFKKLLKKIKKQGYTHLVTDRYFYDSIVNIEYLTQNLFFKKNKNYEDEFNISANTQTCLVIKIIEKIIPRPSKAFYLSVSPDKIINRDRIPEQGLNYLKIKYSILNQKFREWNLQKVVGENSKKKVFQILKENLT